MSLADEQGLSTKHCWYSWTGKEPLRTNKALKTLPYIYISQRICFLCMSRLTLNDLTLSSYAWPPCHNVHFKWKRSLLTKIKSSSDGAFIAVCVQSIMMECIFPHPVHSSYIWPWKWKLAYTTVVHKAPDVRLHSTLNTEHEESVEDSSAATVLLDQQ